MNRVVAASSPTFSNPCCSIAPNPRTSNFSSSDLGLRFTRTRLRLQRRPPPRSSTDPGAPGSGDGESKNVLDAFFLGKALAEALNERIESTVGEFLSTVGRLQAEQQKQVQDFQNEVLERAKKAKEKAAREAMEAQGGLVPKSSSAINTTSITNGASPMITGSSSSSEAGTDQDPADIEPVI